MVEFLKENNEEFEIRDIINQPPTVEELKEVLVKLGLEVDGIIRKDEALFKEKFKDKVKTEEEKLKMLSENPKLIQRPIVIKENNAVIGRPLENVKSLL